MSWSESFGPCTLDELRALEPVNPQTTEARDQFDATRAAAVAVVESGVVGDPKVRRFLGGLSGHANPGHAPASGYANDCVYVSIGQAVEASG
jgi:hypothetical protein